MSQTVQPDVIEFLAQLDFLVECPNFPKWSLSDRNADEKIRDVIREICRSKNHQYTADYVWDTLWREFQPSYVYPEFNFACLFRHGSWEIKTLDENARLRVKRRLEQIRSEKNVQNSRSLRSQSVFTASVPTPSASRKNNHAMASRPSKLGPKKKRTTPLLQDACVSKKAAHKYTANSSPSKNKPRSRSRKRKAEPSAATLRGKGKEKLPSIPEDDRVGALNNPQPNGLLTQRPKPTIQELVGGRDKKARISSEADTLAEIHKATVSQLGQYKHRCQKLERERDNLTNEVRKITSIFAQENGTGEAILREMRLQAKKIIALKCQLEDQRHLEPYLAIGSVRDDTLTTQKLHSSYEGLKNEITSILVVNSERQVLVEPLYGQSDDLDTLLCTIFQASTTIDAGNELITALRFTLREILQALIGAAVKVWIFENTFRSTYMLTTPLLQKYRQQIQAICGHEGLYNLDMATHEALIQEEDFEEHVIVPIASRLTKRLQRVLRLVPGVRNADDASDLTVRLAPRFAYIMRLAVHVRSLSLVSNQRFEMIWPSPGALFDELAMSVEHNMAAEGVKLVKLPILPGLIAYPKKKEMTTYQGFMDRGSKGGMQKYILQAMVIA